MLQGGKVTFTTPFTLPSMREMGFELAYALFEFHRLGAKLKDGFVENDND